MISYFQLTHNVHGPHDEKFYKLLSELEEEYYELQRNGYSGEGFFTEGKKLGGSGGIRNVPPHLARQKALEAAERRRKVGLLSSGSGQALGGHKGVKLSPRELAARVRTVFTRRHIQTDLGIILGCRASCA